MSADLTTTYQAAPCAPGPYSSDSDLAAWRDAAGAGALPLPTRHRWQVLRAGVVNLWEFDVAEYWHADGRASFVGANQSGKSTLMALTTLILLAGDLDRSLVDTFGQQHKSFRYYVQPTNDPTDRRAPTTAPSRGWAWAEYGRVDEDGTPEYFTTALYTQARAGDANDYVKKWVTCHGQARVGEQLALHTGASTSQASDLTDVPGYRLATSGKEYKQQVATVLFGFEDTDRLDAVVRMLKVLRTPHLGQKLDPDFFTARMRDALPAIARSEIDELAEGWDQLDRLAADRDAAAAARDAVKGYVRLAWNPWADTVIRRASDQLVAANTGLDKVTRTAREAAEKEVVAESAARALDTELTTATEEHDSVAANVEQHLQSQAYLDAASATANVAQLESDAASKKTAASRTGTDSDAATARATEHQGLAGQDAAQVDELTTARAQAAHRTATAGALAGLDPACEQWAAQCDTTRLSAAVAERRNRLSEASKLLGTAQEKKAVENVAAQRAGVTATESTARRTAAENADTTLAGEVQMLSDALETWALTTGANGPRRELRDRWIDAASAQRSATKPRSVLGDLVRGEWLEALLHPLREQVTLGRSAATALRKQAGELEGRADVRERQVDPPPPTAQLWARRDRPTAGDAGAPLWRLLDPVDDLPADTLNHIEAALAAAGLLDAWVSPDGLYLPERDGHDAVLAPPTTAAQGTVSLAQVLAPAADAGACTAAIAAVLSAISYTPTGPAVGPWAISGDGRWRHPLTSGWSSPSVHGAELVGTAARTAARAREVADLRAQAGDLRTQAADHDFAVDVAKREIANLESVAATAPGDHEVVAATFGVQTAQNELAAALIKDEEAQRRLQRAGTAAANANTELLTYTARYSLPHNAPALAELSAALVQTDTTIRALDVAHTKLTGAVNAAHRSSELAEKSTESAEALAGRAESSARAARLATQVAERARAMLGHDAQRVLGELETLRKARTTLADQIVALHKSQLAQQGIVSTAQAARSQADTARTDAEDTRDSALVRWWIPVDAGLTALRGVPEATGRLITPALTQAQAARRMLTPTGWPDDAQDKDAKVIGAFTKLTGNALVDLRTTLETSGGRSVSVADGDGDGDTLPMVSVLVDSAGTQVSPVEAIKHLDDQAAALAELHDAKIHVVLVELLASTFVEHLRERLGTVIELLTRVNAVLANHPTGANRTSLRLRRIASGAHKSAFRVLEALESGFVDSEEVQSSVRDFLEQQIRTAQDLGRGGERDWKDHLADQLDYRAWFDVITEYRVGQTGWRALTKEVHAKDSGGGKVITLLQPLLATLVALYNESPSAPRPLWLDEAFTGVDDDNRATMLAMLVTFDLDFLLAGPSTLVAAAQVPCASVWHITRAPAPTAGVDLSLMLWAGRHLSAVALPDITLDGTRAEADLFDFDLADQDTA